ncbi:MAG: tetratricopeptide repeat protein [Candidatus Omnitrophica bacterium]|nr:tetratricopeptide repeat protein [Candidatus Omnitrophota bacterium]
MNRIFVLAVLTVEVCLFSLSPAYGSSFGDMFGGKKAQEYKAMIEEKEQECQLNLEEKDLQYQQLFEDSKDSREDSQGMRDKNATLMEAYEKLKRDQENILVQLNRLRREGQQCESIKESFDQMTAEKESFLKEKEAFLKEKESLEQKAEQRGAIVENLKLHLKEVTAEKDQLAVFLAEAQEDEDVKVKNIRDKVKDEMEGLRNQVNILEQENRVLAKQLKGSQKGSRLAQMDNSGLKQKMELLEAEVEAFEKQYDEIKKENRYLAQEATQFPKKFADLARHNRKLVKETADMHYNLGVSNIKNKEFGRAIKEFEKVLELKPQDAYANYNLGYIYAEHLVDRHKAIKYFKDYLAYAPDARDANWVRKYIMTWQTWYGKNQLR